MWVAVGGTPQSAVRAAERGLPMAVAIIGGQPDRFAVFTRIHRQTLVQSGFDPARVPIAVHAHGFVGRTTAGTVDEYYPSYALPMSKLGAERGWGPMTRAQYDVMCGPSGSLVIGDPATVAAKIIRWGEVLDLSRFMLHMSVGTLPHERVLECIRLLGTEVAPLVRAG